MISKKILLAQTLSRLGPRALRLAGQHRLRLKRKWYAKKYPVADWRTDDVRFVSPFVIPKAKLEGEATGEVSYFSWDRRPLPEDWHRHPITGHQYPKTHWSRIPMFAGGDIKWIWEASRMDWAVHSARIIAGRGTAATLIAELTRWRDQNRPNEGVNWACGQETSFRMFALMICATVLQDRDRDAAKLIRAMLPQHAERVEQAITYAISQHNNHGLSETVALFLAGHALPDHPRASAWRHVGKSSFVAQVHEQFTDDGWYAQHSHNYTRVALLDGLIAMRVAAFFGDPLPKAVIKKFAAAARLLAGVCRDGRVPNYGSNDGANVLPLHDCDYSDFRPIIAAVLRAAGEASPFEAGPWDELSHWFGLPLGESSPVTPMSAPEGGYYVISSGEWLGAVRCHTYTDRPAHADMLHVDLWHGDLNLLRDGGTYSYNDPDGVGDFLKSTAAHNAITVDGEDQMIKGSRFLWLYWTESKKLTQKTDEFSGEHYGYRTRMGAVHRRRVILKEEVTIEDEIYAVTDHTCGLVYRLGGSDWVIDGQAVRNDQFEVSFSGIKTLDIELIPPTDEVSLYNAESTHYGRLDRTFAVRLGWKGETSRLVTTIRKLG